MKKNSINNELRRLVNYYKNYKELEEKFNNLKKLKESKEFEESDEEIDEETKKYMRDLVKKYSVDDDYTRKKDDTRKKDNTRKKDGFDVLILIILKILFLIIK